MRTLELEELGTKAVKQLRVKRLRSGLPFLISSRSLPSDQSYLEYPSGVITLVTYTRRDKEFVLIRELSAVETARLRDQFELQRIAL